MDGNAMLTPNELKERFNSLADDGEFKSLELNTFLNEFVETYETMFQENKELIRKISVLASKIEDYRKDEDSIRSALLVAQRTADSIMTEAQQKIDESLEAAEKKANEIIEQAKESARQEALIKEDMAAGIIEQAETMLSETVTEAEELVLEAKNEAKKIKDEALSNIQEEATEIKTQANNVLMQANEEAKAIILNAKEVATEINQKANVTLAEAKNKAQEILNKSHDDANVFAVIAQKDSDELIAESKTTAADLLLSAKRQSDVTIHELKNIVEKVEPKLNDMFNNFVKLYNESTSLHTNLTEQLMAHLDLINSFNPVSEDAKQLMESTLEVPVIEENEHIDFEDKTVDDILLHFGFNIVPPVLVTDEIQYQDNDAGYEEDDLQPQEPEKNFISSETYEDQYKGKVEIDSGFKLDINFDKEEISKTEKEEELTIDFVKTDEGIEDIDDEWNDISDDSVSNLDLDYNYDEKPDEVNSIEGGFQIDFSAFEVDNKKRSERNNK